MSFKNSLMLVGTTALMAWPNTAAVAQSRDQALVLMDVWLEAQRDYNQWPSVSVAFIHDQETVFSKAYGYANKRKKRRATPDTVYSICSISKLFTATGVMQLRDAGKVDLRTPVGEYLDWYAIEATDPKGGPVTLANMLSHSSGLMREVDAPYWSGPDFKFPTREEVKSISAKQKTLYRPYDHYQYSNLALTLAGEVITSVSGTDYSDYIQQNILNPLDMSDTYTSIPKKLEGKALAVGYGALDRKGNRAKVKLFDAKGINPAAGYASTVKDLAKFAKWQFRILADSQTEILDHNTLREMQRPHFVADGWKSARGLGFGVYPSNGTVFVGHGGSCPGYQTQIVMDNKTQTGMVTMVNAGGVNVAAVNRAMHKIMAGKLKASTKDKKAEKAPAFKAADFEGIYSNQPWGGQDAIFAWDDGLASVNLRTKDPMGSLGKLKHVEGDTFIRLRKDGSEAEPVIFHRKNGKVIHVQWHSTTSPKVKGLK